MTIEDVVAREGIRHTLASYNKAGDADDPRGFAECFTEQGVLLAPDLQFVGREEIRRWKSISRVFLGGGSGKDRAAPFRVHHVTQEAVDHSLFDQPAVFHPKQPIVIDAGMIQSDVGEDQPGGSDVRTIRRYHLNMDAATDNSYIAPELIGSTFAEWGA